MNQVRVLQIIDSMKTGGAEGLLLELCKGLVRRGYRVSVCYNTPGPRSTEFEGEGIETFRLRPFARVDPTLVVRLMQVMHRDPPQIVHTHLFKSDMHGRFAARASGVPVVFSTLHNNDIWARRLPLGRLYGLTARFTDCLIAVSDQVKRYHVRYTGVPADKVVTIENGIDCSRFFTESQPGARVRGQLGISPDAPLFGAIGRLVPQKNHAMLIRAAAEIVRVLPNARFLVVGEGPLRSELEEQAGKLGLIPTVVFAGLRPDIPAVLSALDVLVFTSKWEGLPLALLEGMAAGKPVVATAVDGVLDVMVDGATGLLAPPDGTEALVHACLKLMEEPALRMQMGNAGRSRVLERFSIDSMIDRTISLYSRFWEEYRGSTHARPEPA